MSNFDQCWVSGSLDRNVDINTELQFYATNPKLRHTYFDLASLTKVLCTSTLLVRHKLDLGVSWDEFFNVPVSKEIVEFQNTKLADLTIGELWEHRSGLKSHVLLFTPSRHSILNRKEKIEYALDEIVQLHQNYLADKDTVYSDLGFLVLGFYLERYYAANLSTLFDNFKAEHRIPHIKLKFPIQLAPLDRVLKTELRHPEREANDDNATAFGGIAAHAGLFGMPEEILKFVRHLYSWSEDNEKVRDWLYPKGKNRFYCGWDRPTEGENSQAGFPCPEGVIGHLGYTGTALWLDPKSQRVGIHLSNRIFPDDSEESKTQIKKLRQKFFSAYWQGTIRETCQKEMVLKVI